MTEAIKTGPIGGNGEAYVPRTSAVVRRCGKRGPESAPISYLLIGAAAWGVSGGGRGEERMWCGKMKKNIGRRRGSLRRGKRDQLILAFFKLGGKLERTHRHIQRDIEKNEKSVPYNLKKGLIKSIRERRRAEDHERFRYFRCQTTMIRGSGS